MNNGFSYTLGLLTGATIAMLAVLSLGLIGVVPTRSDIERCSDKLEETANKLFEKRCEDDEVICIKKEQIKSFNALPSPPKHEEE